MEPLPLEGVSLASQRLLVPSILSCSEKEIWPSPDLSSCLIMWFLSSAHVWKPQGCHRITKFPQKKNVASFIWTFWIQNYWLNQSLKFVYCSNSVSVIFIHHHMGKLEDSNYPRKLTISIIIEPSSKALNYFRKTWWDLVTKSMSLTTPVSSLL